ncbi:hypothetical protein VTJ04DRAFT_3250 [Mycothermus thermophilus]|uniref:uncharacterized protein n=1 Tax=Humicola insolens TaxID=85995 RepID=UPI00374235B1
MAERPTKRPRLGGPTSLQEEEEDPEADELLEQPDVVNARRDPNARLERGRARAAFKLKSAFERIFAKYERDFTGVADEIDLRTGRIVVDNGHVRGMGEVQLGGEDDEDEDGDEGEEEVDGELEEEEDVHDDALAGTDGEGTARSNSFKEMLGPIGQAGHVQMQAAPQPPLFFPVWPGAGAGPFPGALPLAFPGFMYPGAPMAPGLGLPMMPYGPPPQLPTTDPLWKAPDLPAPSPYGGNASLMTGGQGRTVASVKKKVARLSLSVAREQEGPEDDDTLLDAPAPAVKQKILPPHPIPQEKGSTKKTPKAPGRKRTQPPKTPRQEEVPAVTRADEGKEILSRKNPTNETGAAQGVPTPPETSEDPASSPPPRQGVEEDDDDADKPAEERRATPVNDVVAAEQESQLDPSDPDVYLSFSGDEATFCRKPRNQLLQVEIPVMEPMSFSYELVSSEEDDKEDSLVVERTEKDQPSSQIPAAVPEEQSTATPGDGPKVSKPTTENFSRNVIDPAYAFSDEDEPSLPRWKVDQRKPRERKSSKRSASQPSVLREISQNVSPGPTDGSKKAKKSVQKSDKPAAKQTEPPPASPQLGEAGDSNIDHTASSKKGRRRRQSLRTNVGEFTHDGEASKNDETPVQQPLSSKLPQRSAEETSTSNVQTPDAQLPTSIARRRRSKSQLRDTPSKTPRPRGLSLRASTSLRRAALQEEIPETSPQVQTTTPIPARTMMAASSPLILESDITPVHQEDKPAEDDISISLGREPSPTLTDPTSKPDTVPPPEPPASMEPQPAGPSTPVRRKRERGPGSKKHTHPTSGASKRSRTVSAARAPSTAARSAAKPAPSTTAATTTATTTNKTKRQSILSLLHHDNNEDEDEDELLLTPVRPRSIATGNTASIRSTPAFRHVRLALLRTADDGGSRSPTGLRRDNALPQTPSGRKRKLAATAAGVGGAGVDQEEDLMLVQTPGGTMRRCGEDGFRCEREFCFRCL